VAAVVVQQGSRIAQARLAFGGLATKPWRVEAAEAALERGEGAKAASNLVLAGARTTPDNTFKLALLSRVLDATLAQAMQGARS
jgi:xanthine dehydrogenase YagS FAD-binding subunit